MADGLGESPEESVGRDNDAHAAKPYDNLPMVVAPKLGAGEEPVDETESADQKPAAAHRPAGRLLVLAGTLAFASAFAAFVGSVSGASLAHYLYSAPAAAPVAETTADATRQMKLQLAELTALKSNIDAASRSTATQFAKISDRLDRIDQRVASVATPDVTGSIAPATPAAAPSGAGTAAAAPAAPAPKLADRILQDWIVHDVQGGRALVESRFGGIYDVGAGSMLPGVGRVDSIRREDGQWIVLTARGTITSGR